MKPSHMKTALILAAFSLALMISICAYSATDDASADSSSDFWKDGIHYRMVASGYEIIGADGSLISSDLTIQDFYYDVQTYCAVKSVGGGAFEGITTLEKLTLSGSLENINASAFKNCTNLEEVSFNSLSIQSISESAFEGCSDLELVTFMSANIISDIEDCAFKGCVKLTDFSISFVESNAGSVTYGDRVFEGCTGLVHVTSKKTYSFGDYPFLGCTAFEGIRLVDNDTASNTDYGPVYKDTTCSTLLHFPAAMNVTSYTFGETVTTLADRSFEGTLYLEQVTLPRTITSISIADYAADGSEIERGAFTDCLTLKKITITGASQGDNYYVDNYGVLYGTINSKTVLCRFPADAENSGVKIKNIRCASGTDIIAPCAFYKCSTLETIGFDDYSSLASIGNYAFQESGLKEFKLGAGMTNTVVLGETVFKDCSKLTSFHSRGIAVIPEYTFSGCSKLNQVELVSGLTTVGDSAFYNCTSLMSIDFPSTITSIYVDENYVCTVFDGCTNLSVITVDDSCTSYVDEDGALYCTPASPDRTLLIKYPVARTASSCVINRGEGIAPKAFYGCTMILSVTIECTGWDGSSIGTDAFRGCTSLIEVINRSTSGLTVVAGSESNGCIGLYARDLYVHNDSVSTSQVYTVNLTGVGNCHFIEYSNDYDYLLKYVGNNTTITFPESYVYSSVTHTRYVVYERAFADNEDITKVILSSGIAYLVVGAFSNCSALTTLDVGTYVGTLLDSRFFVDCNSLVRIEADNNVYKSNEATDYILHTNDLSTIVMYPYARPDTSFSVTKSVGQYAFLNCSNLSSISIGTFVTDLGDYAFMNCTGLTSVIIPLQVTTVGVNVFDGCDNITSITMPIKLDATIFSSCTRLNTLWFIGSGSDCYIYDEDTTKLTPWYLSNDSSVNVTIGIMDGDSPTTLDGYLFYGCTSIASVTLSNSVTYVGSHVFYGNTKMTSLSMPITLDASNMSGCMYLTSLTFTPGSGTEAGKGFTYDSTTCMLTPWCSSQTNEVDITFSEGITEIGSYMFSQYEGTEEITFASSITTIGAYAFYGSGVEELTFPSGCSLVEIKANAFAGSSLKGYVGLPYGLRTIGDYAFMNCTALTSIKIPQTVIDNESFGTGILNGCSALSMLYLPVTLDATDLTNTYDSLLSMRLTVGSDTNGIVSGVSRSYSDSDYQNTIWHKAPNFRADGLFIEDGVTTIGNNMFRSFTAINTVTVGGAVTTIGSYAFADCTNLISFGGLLNSASTIGDYAFTGCSNVTELTVSNSITSIGEGAFTGCTGIRKLSTPINIDSTPFSDCVYLREVVFTKGNGATEGIGFDYDASSCQELPWYLSRTTFTNVSVDVGVKYLGDYLLYGCYNVTTVTFAVDVEDIGDYTFAECRAFSGSLTFPDKLKTIGDGAFSGCSSISIIEIPESIQSIGDGAFSGCNSINELQFPVYINALVFSGCFDSGETTKMLRITSGTGTSAGVGYSYTESDYYQLPWAYLTDYLSVAIYNGVTSIGSYMFYRCSAIQAVDIPASMTSIGDYAFAECSNMGTLTFSEGEGTPVQMEIGDYTFSRGTFSSVSIPDRVTSIGAHAFENCNSLVTVTISNNSTMVSIGEYAFAYSPINTINIPANITDIEAYTFYDTSLSSVTFVNLSNLLRIKNSAFASTNLTSFVIPDTISSVGTDIFNECDRLAEITIPVDINLVCLHGANNITDVSFTYGKNGKCLDYSSEGLQSYTDLPWNSPNHSGMLEVCFGEGITKVGENLFNGAKDLVSVTYYTESDAADMRTIGSNAYRGCVMLSSIDLPEGIREIGVDAFFGCTTVTGITIPSTVQSMGESPFRSCTGLYNIVVSSENQFYCSDGGVLFNKDKSKLLKHPCMDAAAYTVPDTVEQISPYAFEGCRLSGISFGTDVSDISMTIGAHAFDGCSRITLLELPAKIRAIGEYAFYGCTSVKDIKFEGTEISIDTMAFALGLPKQHVTCDVYSENDIDLAYYTDSNTTFNYKLSKYKITFNWNNGSEVKECERNAVIELPADPESYNDTVFKYVFSYWNGYTAGMIADSDKTFNAIYDSEYVGYTSPTIKKATIMITPDNAKTVKIGASTVQKIKDDVWAGLVSELIINLNTGSVTFDTNSLYNITIKDINASIAETDNSQLPEAIAKTVGDKTVYNVSLGDIHEFMGTLTVAIKYEVKEGEYEDKFVMWHMADNGSYTEVKAMYIDGSLTYEVSDLSYFAVAQSQGDTPTPTPTPSQSDEGIPVYVYIIIAAVVVLAVIGLVVFIRRRR